MPRSSNAFSNRSIRERVSGESQGPSASADATPPTVACLYPRSGRDSVQNVRADYAVQRLDGVRRTNLAVVANVIDRLGIASQTAIVKETGLANGAAASLLAQLRDLALVVPADNVATGAAGRPRRGVRLNPTYALAVGVEVSAESISIRICGSDGRQLASSYERITESLGETPRAMALNVFAHYNELVRSADLPDVPASIVVSIPGVISGSHLSVPPFGWTDGSADDLIRAAPLRVRYLGVVNDGDAAVIAEAALRPELECVAALHGSDGVGGGVALNGRLFSGAGGAAGQFGHVVVEKDGRPCYCGNRGCLRQYISTASFAQELDEDRVLASVGFRRYALDLAERASTGDDDVLAILANAKERVAQIVGVLGAILSPQVVVLTGSLAPLAPWIASSPASRISPDEYRAQWARPVEGSALGSESVMHGATLAARTRILGDPLKFVSE